MPLNLHLATKPDLEAPPPGIGDNAGPKLSDYSETISAAVLRTEIEYDYADAMKRVEELIDEDAKRRDRFPKGFPSAEVRERANDVAKQIKDQIAHLKDLHEKTKKPFLDCGRVVDGWFNAERIKPLDDALAWLMRQATAWDNQVRAAASLKARQEKEAAEKAAAEMLALSDIGKATDEAVDAAIATAESAARAVERPVAAVTRVYGSTTGGVSSQSTKWAVKVVDKTKVPLEYLIVDEAGLLAMRKVRKWTGAEVGGVEFVEEFETKFRR